MTETDTKVICKSENDLPKAAKALLNAYPDHRIFTLYGPMGVGKTTFIKALCNELGVAETVSSPSFSLVNQYLSNEGYSVYHFDFYRIKKIEEVYDIGYEDYFFSGNFCFIEWPEKIDELIPEKSVKVLLEEINKERVIHF
ncbi:MAG: tRNA (adenosine(37)-N6)-threonylcarbamoyltransferase complex ATPase subunit type 1 TsaE [Bacteroidota bacterium]